MKRYSYIGPPEVTRLLSQPSTRRKIDQEKDVLSWIQDTRPHVKDGQALTVAFIVDTNENLWIADRHSEHFVCARGEPVLSAGEITFELGKTHVEITDITNQSTGYVPEPESFPPVDAALSRAGILHPDSFTIEFVFRLCSRCRTINIVKDGWFVCSVCQSELSREWNFGCEG